MRRVVVPIGISLLIGPLAGCDRDTPATAPPVAPTEAAAFTMTDVTADSGLDLVTTSGRTPSTQIVEVKGGGLALLDYDGDGDLDLFVPNGATLDAPDEGPGCRLYENLGDLRFRDVTTSAGLSFRRWGMGVAVGDYDGDGHEDLYVACFGRDALLRNLGDGRFADVTVEAGIDVDGWSTGCAFGDLDGDGDLDLYVARYVEFDPDHPPAPSRFRGRPVFAGPRGLPAARDVVLMNVGGRFRDVTGMIGVELPASYGLGVLIVDLDGDGRNDVFVGNDSAPNFLLRNRGASGEGQMRFVEVGLTSGLARSGDGSNRATMGIAIADVDDDGRPDLFTTNFAGEPNTIHLGRANGFHDDGSRRFGVGMPGLPFVGWACGFYDLDQDGGEDLLVFNGHVYPEATAATMLSGVAQPPLLMRRDGQRFTRVDASEAGNWLDTARCERTAVFGDLDGDGDIDVVTAGLNAPLRLLRNDNTRGHWLIVEPLATPLGCRVEVTRGDERWRRWIASGPGYLSASAASAHFGLGASADPVNVHLIWPDGAEQRLPGVAVDQHLRVER